MKQMRKALCLLLALALACSVFAVPAFAADFIFGQEVDGRVNYKYEVAKASEAPMADGSATYVGDDIYAVSVYAKSANGMDFYQAPIYYNKDHFAPIMMTDGSTVYSGYDGWYTDMGDDSLYVYSRGDAWQNTGMYNASGAATTLKPMATFIGLGHANADQPQFTIQSFTTDHPNYAKYHTEDVPDNIGVVGTCIDITGVLKTSYLNGATEGAALSTDWVRMITVYFQRQPGVTDAECVGDTFGAWEGVLTGVDSLTDGSGAPSRNASTYFLANPGCAVVSNAVVEAEAPAGPVVEKSKAELKFTLTSAETVADDYLFRVTSKVSDADWDAYFANTGTADATTNAIQALGFVAYKGTEGFSMDTAKAVAQGTPAEGYYNATTDYVQKESDTSDALFGAIIDTSKDTDADATYVAYIQYLDAEGQPAYAFYETAQTALLEQNYETYVQQYVTTYGGSFAA